MSKSPRVLLSGPKAQEAPPLDPSEEPSVPGESAAKLLQQEVRTRVVPPDQLWAQVSLHIEIQSLPRPNKVECLYVRPEHVAFKKFSTSELDASMSLEQGSAGKLFL